ncbi:MAG TPA: DUF1552 domain-containing protein [Planctomycetota bacterium]|nr:DUF1552 domain-containing protein [Planctomycetota bacterium]
MLEAVSRRSLLRGAGIAIALPWLESMARACAPLTRRTPPSVAPLRLLFIYSPNGAQMDLWTPARTGALEVLPRTLGPLEPWRSSLLVLSGLTHDKARPHGDGPGDHARAAAAFLTAAQPRKTAGADLRVGISVDQVVAAALGTRTRLRSLELGTESAILGNRCDSGYACAYASNISWRGPSTPAAKEIDPRLVFERLFSDGPRDENASARAERLARRKSVLDSVRADARSLDARLGVADRQRLQEYLYGVRELERRIEAAEKARTAAPDGAEAPSGIPESFAEHVRVLGGLLALAFATDSTRVASLMLANEGSNRAYPELGVPEGHHFISHHGNVPENRAKVALIDRFHVSLLAEIVGLLAARVEGEETLLDHCLVVYGSGISDGNRHNHEDLPMLLVGRGGGVQSGRHLQYPADTPCANLFLDLLGRAGVARSAFGDSTGLLEGYGVR